MKFVIILLEYTKKSEVHTNFTYNECRYIFLPKLTTLC